MIAKHIPALLQGVQKKIVLVYLQAEFSFFWDMVITAHSPTESLHPSLALEEIGQNRDPYTEGRNPTPKYSLCN